MTQRMSAREHARRREQTVDAAHKRHGCAAARWCNDCSSGVKLLLHLLKQTSALHDRFVAMFAHHFRHNCGDGAVLRSVALVCVEFGLILSIYYVIIDMGLMEVLGWTDRLPFHHRDGGDDEAVDDRRRW